MHRVQVASGTLVVAILLFVSFGQGFAAEFYVSPAGSDDNPGSKEKPFGSLRRAALAVQTHRSKSPQEAVTVILSGGRYELKEPWVFQPRDSGAAGAPVTWRAAEGESSVISGGKSIQGWRQKDRLWVAEVPWVQPNGPYFYQLFVNGQRRVRARTPNEGQYFYTRSMRMTSGAIPSAYGFSYGEEGIGPEMRTFGAVVVLFHTWLNSYNRIDALDPESRRVRFLGPAGPFLLGQQNRYYVENTMVALDVPGEWFLDVLKSELYYYPMPGEDMRKVEVIAPGVSSPMIRFEGNPEAGAEVQHLRFQGISFQHSDVDLNSNYPRSPQAAIRQRGALVAVGLRHSSFEECEFSHLGEHGISLLGGCSDNRIRQCHFYDLGAGGVYLSDERPIGADARLLTLRNAVENNFIHDGGRIFQGACGIALGSSASYNQILHNEICDFSWTGIHVGWSWTGLQPTHTHHNEIAWNRVHHLGNGVLSDLAGIYTLGVSPGTFIHHNLIHDISRFERGGEGYGGWGIYLDAGSSEIVVAHNIVYDTRDGGLHLHCDAQPHGNVVTNNVFAYSAGAQIVRNNNKEAEGIHAVFERNIVTSSNPLLVAGSWVAGAKMQVDRNCYWSEGTTPPRFSDAALDGWRKLGRDIRGVVADPLFRDPARRDFRLRPNSPAFKLGIEPVDLREAGLAGPSDWRSLPGKVTHRKPEVAAGTADTGFTEDFEDYNPGMEPTGAAARDGGTSALVVTNLPHAGRQCLQLTDASEGTAWKPHWSVMRDMGDGSIRFSCWIRNDSEHPVRFQLEGRDWRSFKPGDRYWTGPLLNFRADGLVQVASLSGWTTIGKYPMGIWTRVVLDLSPGGAGSKGFGVSVSTDKGVEFTRQGLGYVHNSLRSCNWFGVSGSDAGAGVFYLDDVRFEPGAHR